MWGTPGAIRKIPCGYFEALWSGMASAWGVLGVCALLTSAVLRLFPVALDGLRGPLPPVGWAVFAGSVAFLGYFEGYKAFHRGFAPRVVARALAIPLRFAPIAPLFCMGLVHATRRRLVSSWGVTLGVVALVLLVRQLAQPWRGAVDAGVVVGLSWGVLSTLWFWLRALRGDPPRVPADLPLSG